MNISNLLERAAAIAWRRRALWPLSLIWIVTTSSGLVARTVEGWLAEFARRDAGIELPPGWPELPPGPIPLDRLGEAYAAISSLGTAGWIAFGIGFVIALIVVGVLAMVALGGAIAGGAEREGAEAITTGAAMQAGWRRAWPMIIIASIPAIPVTLAAILIVAAAWALAASGGGIEGLAQNGDSAQSALAVLSLISAAILCPASVLTTALQLLAGLAYRACMLDGTGAIESFRRGWGVLRGNFGTAALLAALHVGIDLAAGALISLPRALSTVFLPAIVIVWGLQSAARLFTLEIWTLAWQGWTGKKQ